MAFSAAFEPIRELDVTNYGCVRHATVQFSRLHALIGPNDSGKSTLLRALRTVAQFATGHFGEYSNTNPEPFDPMLRQLGNKDTAIAVRYQDGVGYSINGQQDVRETVYRGSSKMAKSTVMRAWNRIGFLNEPSELTEVRALRERLSKPTMVRLDPNSLRRPAKQILSAQPIGFLDETGAGLASVYQAINSREVDAFVAIRDRVRELFPNVQNILVPTVEDGNVALQARLIDGTLVDAPGLSEGLLYFLAFSALRQLQGTHLFLVEEPENGLHPSRVCDVMDILREISKTNQVVIATHSPLVVNELQGDEVTVVTRKAGSGTQVKLLKDVPGFEDASKVYRPGEFWVSYADGKAEEPLLTGQPRQ